MTLKQARKPRHPLIDPFQRTVFQVSGLFGIILSLFATTAVLHAQMLPREIRGYRVHHVNMKIRNSEDLAVDPRDQDFRIELAEPTLANISISGITFSVPISGGRLPASGTVDFLTFRGFRVGAIPVEIEEYKGPISFEKGELFELRRPATVFVARGGLIEAAWNEFQNSKQAWTITGQVFVFATFRKMGMNFKRVIPVDIDVRIRNPFHSSK